MHYAACYGHDNIVKLLIDKTNIDIIDNDGWSALHLAVANNRLSTIKLLISFGANINTKNNNDMSPLDTAKFFGYHDIIVLLS